MNIALVRFSASPGFLVSSATRAGIGIRGEDGPAMGDDGCVDVLPDSTESREDWKDELPVSSSDLGELPATTAPFEPWRDLSLRKKSAAVVLGPSSSVTPLVGGDAVGGHEGLGGRLRGFVCGGEDDDADVEGRGDVAEEGVEVAVPPPRKRRTPFICFCGRRAGI